MSIRHNSLKKFIEEESNFICETFMEGNEILGWFVTNKGISLKKIDKIKAENALREVGADLETFEFWKNTTEEEREEIKTIAKIAYHKKQLELLQTSLQDKL